MFANASTRKNASLEASATEHNPQLTGPLASARGLFHLHGVIRYERVAASLSV